MYCNVYNYCDTISANIKKFLSFVDVTGDTTGANLAAKIKSTLTDAGLSLSKLRGQCYVGAGMFLPTYIHCKIVMLMSHHTQHNTKQRAV